jgi:hypothetical protein
LPKQEEGTSAAALKLSAAIGAKEVERGMTRVIAIVSFVCLTLELAASAQAQQDSFVQAPAPQQPPAAAQPAPQPPTRPPAPQAPPGPMATTQPGGAPPAPEAGAEALASAATPNMIGDLLGLAGNQVVRLPNGATATARIPPTVAGAFKISENESPRPTDRVFFTYNFFSNVDRSLNPPSIPSFDAHREVFGFEKTFLDEYASIGLRVPAAELTGDGSLGQSDFGDISIVFKYAFVNDRPSGDVLSTGLVLTVPSGESFFTVNGQEVNPVLFQPWVGFIKYLDDFYVHGFISVEVPTDSRDVTMFFNDYGIGYRMYHDDFGMITSIVPTFEVHVNTPLNHRGTAGDPLGVPDWVDLTGGVHFGLWDRSSLTLAVGAPVTGPKPFDVEAIVQVNVHF